jgi:hypothetical protein
MSNSYSVTEDIGNGLLELEKLTSLLTTQHICVNGVALTLHLRQRGTVPMSNIGRPVSIPNSMSCFSSVFPDKCGDSVFKYVTNPPLRTVTYISFNATYHTELKQCR